jgi:two-component system phosphate regulon response regulator PhoB
MMPGKIGYEVCEQLKKDPETSRIYIILMSARGRSRIEMAGKMQGADDILPKPFDPLDLAERVRKVIGAD